MKKHIILLLSAALLLAACGSADTSDLGRKRQELDSLKAAYKELGEKIKAGVKSMELHVYEAQHAFCNEQRPEVYNAAAAALSWQRALAFAKAHTV